MRVSLFSQVRNHRTSKNGPQSWDVHVGHQEEFVHGIGNGIPHGINKWAAQGGVGVTLPEVFKKFKLKSVALCAMV